MIKVSAWAVASLAVLLSGVIALAVNFVFTPAKLTPVVLRWPTRHWTRIWK